MNKHEAVWTWLFECPSIKDLFFNFSNSSNGSTMLIPLTAYNDTTAVQFISGAKECWYDFTVVRFDAYSVEANETQNIDVLCDVEDIAAWVEGQDELGNFPEFPVGHTITSVKALDPDAGSVAAQDENGAKYMIQFRIEYIKEG